MKSITDIFKISIEKIGKIIWALGLHAFSLIIFFIFIDLILGSFVFYNYVFQVEKQNPNTTETILKFNDKIYQDMLEKLKTRNMISEDTSVIQLTSTQNNVSSDIEQPVASYIFSRFLGYGDKGDDVLQLQKLLSQQGFLLGTSNGNYDLETFEAVKKFQQANGIKPTGNVGQLTKDFLNKVSN